MGNKIQSTAIRLTSPQNFEEKTLEVDLKPNFVAVEPTLASICHADIRYYTGDRRKDALKNKLPMALFHEGIGKIVKSNNSKDRVGEKVVIIPNIPQYMLEQKPKSTCCSSCASGNPDNYCEGGVFLGSGYDGIGQSRLILPRQNFLTIPKNIPDEIAVLTELCSVSLHAIKQIKSLNVSQQKVAVFGDGPVGFLTALMLRFYSKVPKERLTIFGTTKNKLQQFDFAETHLIYDFDFKNSSEFTVAFECTGGKFSESAINQAIDLISRKGKLVLLGVTEDRVPINTRDVLEKGIEISGSSRSGYNEFDILMDILQNKELQAELKKLLPEKPIEVNGSQDLTKIMDKVVANKEWKKFNLLFNWE